MTRKESLAPPSYRDSLQQLHAPSSSGATTPVFPTLEEREERFARLTALADNRTKETDNFLTMEKDVYEEVNFQTQKFLAAQRQKDEQLNLKIAEFLAGQRTKASRLQQETDTFLENAKLRAHSMLNRREQEAARSIKDLDAEMKVAHREHFFDISAGGAFPFFEPPVLELQPWSRLQIHVSPLSNVNTSKVRSSGGLIDSVESAAAACAPISVPATATTVSAHPTPALAPAGGTPAPPSSAAAAASSETPVALNGKLQFEIQQECCEGHPTALLEYRCPNPQCVYFNTWVPIGIAIVLPESDYIRPLDPQLHGYPMVSTPPTAASSVQATSRSPYPGLQTIGPFQNISASQPPKVLVTSALNATPTRFPHGVGSPSRHLDMMSEALELPGKKEHWVIRKSRSVNQIGAMIFGFNTQNPRGRSQTNLNDVFDGPAFQIEPFMTQTGDPSQPRKSSSLPSTPLPGKAPDFLTFENLHAATMSTQQQLKPSVIAANKKHTAEYIENRPW